jgi:ABC-type transport system involved in multi-copper enzyme maturation permease subunit
MIWTLVRKELLTNLLTFRLSVALVFTVVLSALATFIGSLDFSRNMEAYHEELRVYEEELEETTVYNQVQPDILLPPQPLAIFARGVVGLAPLNYRIQINYYGRSMFSGGASYDSEYMKILVQIDFVTVVALLLSFLAVVLGFDGICGERERGTLKQLLTNPVPRAHVVLAKLVGGVISLWIPFAVAFVICLLITLANDDVAFTANDWTRLVILFGLTCLFLAQVFALSLAVSAFTRDADTALIVCLFAWLVFGVGYLSSLPSFSRYGYPEKPHQNYMDEDRRLWDELGDTMNEWEQNNPPPPETQLPGISRDGVDRFYHPAGYDWWARRNAVDIDKRLERADKSYQAVFHTWDPLAQEAYLVDRWSVVSPFMNYQVLAYQLARTTLDDLFHAGRFGRDYRATIIEYMRSKNAFASRRWFTDDPPDQEPMVPDPAAVTPEMLEPASPFMQERTAWAEDLMQRAADDDRRKLDLSDMPRYGGQWQRTLGASFAAMTPGLALLLLSLGAAILITVMRFLRYDPR